MSTEPNELKERITTKSDEELKQMIERDYADYRKEALDFAREELRRRGVSVDESREYKIKEPELKGVIGRATLALIAGIVLLAWYILQLILLASALSSDKIPEGVAGGWKAMRGLRDNAPVYADDKASIFLYSVVVLGIFYGIPGVLLVYFGHKSTKRKRIISGAARILAEDGFIDVHKLAAIVNAGDEETLKVLTKARGKGEIPADVEIRQLEIKG